MAEVKCKISVANTKPKLQDLGLRDYAHACLGKLHNLRPVTLDTEIPLLNKRANKTEQKTGADLVQCYLSVWVNP